MKLGDATIRHQGHYTLGSGPAVFVPQANPGKMFLVLADDMPKEVSDYLQSQPKHPDLTRESEWSVSAFADVQGQVLFEPDGTARFKATKVFSVGPAVNSYVDAWGKWPPPATFEKRHDNGAGL